MEINFLKTHGAGNDFVIINGLKYQISNYSKLAIKLCDRHFGIGADGLITVFPAQSIENDYRMRIFNPDGSEAEMCGNGIRCFAHFLRNKALTGKDKLRIETLAGLISPQFISSNKIESQIRVNMGRPGFLPQEIPVEIDENLEYIHNYDLKIKDRSFKINCVSMGVPHTVIFTDEDLDSIPLSKWGKMIENHPLFPAKTNVEFVEIISPSEVKMRVWERGVGITLACGTGASSVAVAGIKNGLLDEEVLVHLPGGDLKIEWSGDDVFMTGPARTVFSGNIRTVDGEE